MEEVRRLLGSRYRRDRRTQTSPASSRKVAVEAIPATRERASRTEERYGTARGADRCWNCQAVGHRYSGCPHPKDSRPFCYGCERSGVTMRVCPRCGEDWRDLGPYRPESSHHVGRFEARIAQSEEKPGLRSISP
ncbi:hypothetical protein EAG_04029 [Camponotus floridanus]|uniref:CCHC-type domain-containing protein n=1 Tax=Camponotus floridanus TaxID=104421 RepID=E2AZ85_CAMFO|nr:hypothetical protein EAG_04029 [Camponotus floridanus]